MSDIPTKILAVFLNIRGIALLGAGLFGLSSIGCGANSKLPVYPVHGNVLRHGEPAEGALVIFHPLDKAKDVGEVVPPRPSGRVQSDGSFSLTTSQPNDGARAGDYQVSIVWFQEAASQAAGGLGGRGSEPKAGAKDQLQGKYALPEQSGLTATITPGSNQLEPFELE